MGVFGKATGLVSSKESPLTMQTSNGLDLTYLDGDTWADSDGQRYRLAGGVNLEETAKVIKKDGKTTFKEGHLGGRAATVAMHQLQSRGGFNILEDTGETDEHGRRLVRFTNEKGEDLSRSAIASRIADVTQYTEKEGQQVLEEADLIEELTGEKYEYADIGEELKKEKTPPMFKQKALNELQYAASPDYYDGVQFRHAGRTIDNKSLNPWSDSWDSGWLGVKEGLYGFADLLGQGTGVEWLEDIGEAGIASARQKLQNTPKVLLDYKEVNNVWDGFSFVANNAMMSAPYLAIGLGSALASPFTLGASGALGISALAGTYIGQFWNEMEGERGGAQMAAAITGGTAAAALDRLGLKGIIKPSAFLTKQGQNRAQKALRDKIYGAHLKAGAKISLAEANRRAKEQIGDASKQAILGTINVVGKLTASDIAKIGAGQVAKQGVRGFTSESLTEVAQEGLQAATVSAFSDTTYTQGEVLDRLINAGLAGGTVGGGISTAGAIKESASHAFLRKDLEHQNANLSALDALREADKEAGITTKSVDDIKNETRSRRKNRHTDVNVEEDANYRKAAKQRHQDNNRGIKNIFSNITDISTAFGTAWEGINRLHRASLETAIPTALAVSSPALRKLKALVGNGIIGGTYYDGKGEYAYRQSLIADIETYVNPTEIVATRLGKAANGKSARGQLEASKDIKEFISSGAYAAYLRYERGEGDLDLSKIPTRFHNKLSELSKSVKDFQDGYSVMFEMMKDIYKRETGKDMEPEAARQFADWFNFASPDRLKVKHNQKAFKKFLKDNSNMLDDEINDIYNRIVNGEVNDGTQSLLDTDWRPWNSKLNAVSQAKGWDKFSNENIFETFDAMKDKVAKYTSNAEYYGEGGRNIDELLKEAEEEGIASQDDIDRAAWHVSNIIDSSNHTYNRIQNPRIAALVQMATSWSAFVGLGLSAISSLPETVLIYENIENSQEMRQATMHLAREFLKMFTTGMKNNYKYYFDDAKNIETPKAQQLLDKSGLPLSQTAAQKRIGVGSTSPAMQKWLNKYFEIIGIQGITGWQRRANASFAVDYINNRLESLSFVPTKKDGTIDMKQANRRQQQQYNDLINLGMNPDKLVDIFNASSGDRSNFDILNDSRDLSGLDKKLKIKRDDEADLIAELDEQMQTGIYAFVNQRVQNPQAPNRPLIFQDPTLQVFTQFNGFISTFTAQAMPRIYGNRVLRGSPSTRANTAALIVAMIAMGGASQYLKDFIKFGGKTPYIKDDWRLFQRAVHASGVLGQGERVVDHFLPLYPQRHKGFDKIWNTIVGEAGPTARTASSLGSAADHLTRGDTQRAVNQALKTVPGVALLPEERHALTDLLHGNVPKDYRT